MADYFDYYLSTYDDPVDQRYIVDVTSEPYQIAIRNNLSFIEGVVYNNISYVIQTQGTYIEDEKWRFLHISEKEYNNALSTLAKKNLITFVGNKIELTSMTYDQLKEDQTMKDLGLSDLMEAFKTMMLEVNNG